MSMVVKSGPNNYYGDLLDASGYYEPRYTALVAEAEIRQRVKANWNKQQRFMSPDYG